jgi:ribulose-5-phosphate 4-epimerase/fuculose-1-phosphate aldolase
MSDKTELDAALRDLVIANRILAHEGVLDGFGHVSIRHPTDPGRYFMACSRSPEQVTRRDLIEFHLDSRPIDQNGRPMYAERFIHGQILQARPEVKAICHNHAHNLIPFGVTGNTIRPLMHMSSVIGPEVPIWDIADEFGDTDLLVTNPAMGDSLARCLGQRRVALMRGHGSVVAGLGLREAVFVAVYLHLNAELVLKAKSLGDIKYLSPGEVERCAATLLQELSQNRAWDYWAARAGYEGI